jgi:mannan endo-1,4-beta-mannosidase
MPASPQVAPEPAGDGNSRRTIQRVTTSLCLAICAIAVIIVAIVVVVAKHSTHGRSDPAGSVSYLGLYDPGAPSSYAGIDQFAEAVGRQPNLVVYYSTWLEPFQASFATSAARHGALTLVQMDTAKKTSLAAVADGQYDSYLRTYASAVKKFGRPVILSFDHEMNGDWYPWGYQNSSAKTFVTAWRHVVSIFREQGVRNAKWMWTVNIYNVLGRHVADPAAWWPGQSYVNFVGIDGYYVSPAIGFDALFGPTIADARMLTGDPILIAETGVARSAGQSAKITELFAGIHTFGLLGLVLFDQNGVQESQDWRISSPSVYATLRHDISRYMAPQEKAHE